MNRSKLGICSFDSKFLISSLFLNDLESKILWRIRDESLNLLNFQFYWNFHFFFSLQKFVREWFIWKSKFCKIQNSFIIRFKRLDVSSFSITIQGDLNHSRTIRSQMIHLESEVFQNTEFFFRFKIPDLIVFEKDSKKSNHSRTIQFTWHRIIHERFAMNKIHRWIYYFTYNKKI